MSSSKEEILEDADDNHPYDLGMAMVTERAALEAMSEFAKQEAIGFAVFCGNYGEKGPEGVWSENHWRGNVMAGEPALTTEQLYNLYLQSKNKPINP